MAKDMYVYVGTYTEAIKFGTGQVLLGKGEGIYLYKLDFSSGQLRLVSTTTGVVNPSYLTLTPSGKYLYAVNELKQFDGKESGAVSAFAVESGTSRLSFINQLPTGGADPCYVCVNDRESHVFVTNFMSGSVCVYPILKNGALDTPSQFIQHSGSSVNKTRQTGPHAHSLVFDPSNRYTCVPDLGLDKLMLYKTDFSSGKLELLSCESYTAEPGSGPRHCVFHPNGRFCYMINELNCTISALKFDQQSGSFTLLQNVPTVLGGFEGENSGADIKIHPNGRYLYGSNRGHNSIVIYRVDQNTGLLSPIGIESSRGEIPRNFAIDPTGTFLLVANQDTDNIVVFEIDNGTGNLTMISEVKVPTPVCIKVYHMV
ncbi:MAG: lactonase family protein [Bacteroidota bacterium]